LWCKNKKSLVILKDEYKLNWKISGIIHDTFVGKETEGYFKNYAFFGDYLLEHNESNPDSILIYAVCNP
jgi:hypothetical protein